MRMVCADWTAKTLMFQRYFLSVEPPILSRISPAITAHRSGMIAYTPVFSRMISTPPIGYQSYLYQVSYVGQCTRVLHLHFCDELSYKSQCERVILMVCVMCM